VSDAERRYRANNSREAQPPEETPRTEEGSGVGGSIRSLATSFILSLQFGFGICRESQRRRQPVAAAS